jgi:type II secretory pathway pseudopilin PulG
MVETLTEPMPPPRWYYYFLVVIGVVAILGLAAGLTGLYQNDKNATRQAACFQTFAEQFSSVSTEVREAQVKVDTVEAQADAAAARRDAAFQEVLTLVISRSEDRTEGLRVFNELSEANATLVDKRDALVDARLALQITREEHPIPSPPKSDDGCELLENEEREGAE